VGTEPKAAVFASAQRDIGAALVNAYRDHNYLVVATVRSPLLTLRDRFGSGLPILGRRQEGLESARLAHWRAFPRRSPL
jgi:hypothetical protein